MFLYHGITLRAGQYRWAICAQCDGHGTRDNPAFSNGITSSEWSEWDPDERETYFSGAYDVPCGDCSGSGKVVLPIVSALPFSERRRLVEARREAHWRAQAAAARERAARLADMGYWGGDY